MIAPERICDDGETDFFFPKLYFTVLGYEAEKNSRY